jgi:hypothetical protein
LPDLLTVVLANQIFIAKADLPQSLANRLIRLAAFQNPEFYKAQAMRLPVWNKPRIIGCAENYPQHIGLPRGCLQAVLDLLQKNEIHPVLQDERLPGRKVTTKFIGRLRKDQKTAICRTVAPGTRRQAGCTHLRLCRERSSPTQPHVGQTAARLPVYGIRDQAI